MNAWWSLYSPVFLLVGWMGHFILGMCCFRFWSYIFISSHSQSPVHGHRPKTILLFEYRWMESGVVIFILLFHLSIYLSWVDIHTYLTRLHCVGVTHDENKMDISFLTLFSTLIFFFPSLVMPLSRPVVWVVKIYPFHSTNLFGVAWIFWV